MCIFQSTTIAANDSARPTAHSRGVNKYLCHTAFLQWNTSCQCEHAICVEIRHIIKTNMGNWLFNGTICILFQCFQKFSFFKRGGKSPLQNYSCALKIGWSHSSEYVIRQSIQWEVLNLLLNPDNIYKCIWYSFSWTLSHTIITCMCASMLYIHHNFFKV